MKCRRKFNKLFIILILAMIASSFIFTGADDAVNPTKAHFIPACEKQTNLGVLDTRCLSSFSEQTSNPMDRVFQIIFILFFISPPLIVILLFMIWCELRKRNEHK